MGEKCKDCAHYDVDECDHKFWYEKHTNCRDFKPRPEVEVISQNGFQREADRNG